ASSMIPFRYTPADWLELFLSDRFTFGSWAEHTAGWWAFRSQTNVLVTTYQEMKHSPKASVEQIAALMGVSLTAEQLEKILYKSSFEYMQSNEDEFVPPIFGNGPNQKIMFRSGKSRFSGELIDEAQQDTIDRFALSELQCLGSDFPYAELFM
ncbi:MAG: sulfotransferase domain-containing protein, partial [Anaerolineaceae bacterium]|nr:sulfotransferase domain-containing protein [Anaerolineaceae bacterium]